MFRLITQEIPGWFAQSPHTSEEQKRRSSGCERVSSSAVSVRSRMHALGIRSKRSPSYRCLRRPKAWTCVPWYPTSLRIDQRTQPCNELANDKTCFCRGRTHHVAGRVSSLSYHTKWRPLTDIHNRRYASSSREKVPSLPLMASARTCHLVTSSSRPRWPGMITETKARTPCSGWTASTFR